eukprot:scaffold2541_cov262-Pinguiococcus_pyrenoidosus.AAC.3
MGDRDAIHMVSRRPKRLVHSESNLVVHCHSPRHWRERKIRQQDVFADLASVTSWTPLSGRTLCHQASGSPRWLEAVRRKRQSITGAQEAKQLLAGVDVAQSFFAPIVVLCPRLSLPLLQCAREVHEVHEIHEVHDDRGLRESRSLCPHRLRPKTEGDGG